jgi:hypothetical protein
MKNGGIIAAGIEQMPLRRISIPSPDDMIP